jgi:hypothetical protein
LLTPKLAQISANSYIIDTYQRYTASAVAAKTFLRSVVGATVPLWVNQMYAGMTSQWASTLLGFLAIVAMPIPFIFFYVSRCFIISEVYGIDSFYSMGTRFG